MTNRCLPARLTFVPLWAIVLTACGGGGGGSSQPPSSETPPPQPSPVATVAGAVQKGPFIVGSTITINELTDEGLNTTSTVVTQTADDLGNFVFTHEVGTNVQISATGFFRNEITGAVSGNDITLRSVYSITDASSQNAYVNVLTHVTSERVLELMRNQNLAFDAAIAQAESEFLHDFGSVVPSSDENGFNSFSIYSDRAVSSGSAYLLAVSAIAYQYALDRSLLNATSPDAELSLFLNELAADFATDGIIDMSLSEVRASIRAIDPDAVMANIAAWIGNEPGYTTADINDYLDTDLDGVFNSVDDDDDGDGVADASDSTPYLPGFSASDLSVTMQEDTSVVLDLSANNLNDEPITIEITSAPSSGFLSGHYPLFEYSPASNFNGVDIFRYRLVQGTASSAEISVTITVLPADDAPAISGIPPNEATAGFAYSFTATVLNVDNLSIVFSGTNIPSWATLDADTGTLSGTPTNVQAGVYSDISITATSSLGSMSLGPYSIEVITYPWTNLASMPTPRHSPAVVAYDGSMYVLNGYPGSEERIAERYEIATDSWHALTPASVARTQGATAHVVNDALYLIGGETNSGEIASVEVYSFATDTWSPVSSLSISRSLHASCVHDGMIYAFGGFTEDGEPSSTHVQSLNSVEMYDPSLDTWVSRAPMPEENWGMSCVTLNDRIYVFGGAKNSGGYHVYNPLIDDWEEAMSGTMPATRSYGFLAVAVEDNIYLFGGLRAGLPVDEVIVLNPQTSSWTIKTSMPDVRYNIGGAIWNNAVYLFGGRKQGANELATVWRYDLLLDPR